MTLKMFAVCVVAVTTMASCEGGVPDRQYEGMTREDVAAASDDFWSQMYLKLDYTYFETLRKLWEDTDATIIGRIRTITEGRTLGGRRGERGTVSTALIRIQVDELVIGDLANDSREIVDLEVWHPERSSIEELVLSAPDDPLLLLMQDTKKQPQAQEIDDSAVVRQPGKTLYTIPTPKALFIERGGDVVTPLDPMEGPYEESIQATTLDELADEIRAFGH